MTRKVTEQGERWEACVGIIGLVRGKTVQKNTFNGFSVFPSFMIDCIYEVLVPHLTFKGIVNIHLQKIFKNQISIIHMIILLHSEHHLSLCKIRKLRCEIKQGEKRLKWHTYIYRQLYC